MSAPLDALKVLLADRDASFELLTINLTTYSARIQGSAGEKIVNKLQSALHRLRNAVLCETDDVLSVTKTFLADLVEFHKVEAKRGASFQSKHPADYGLLDNIERAADGLVKMADISSAMEKLVRERTSSNLHR